MAAGFSASSNAAAAALASASEIKGEINYSRLIYNSIKMRLNSIFKT